MKDTQRAARLYESLAAVRFWCEVCDRRHPLHEHTTCYTRTTAAAAAKAREAITPREDAS